MSANAFTFLLPHASSVFSLTNTRPIRRGSPPGGIDMAKNNKSKRFIYQGAEGVKQHAERFPYRSRYSEKEREQKEVDHYTSGGF